MFFRGVDSFTEYNKAPAVMIPDVINTVIW